MGPSLATRSEPSRERTRERQRPPKSEAAAGKVVTPPSIVSSQYPWETMLSFPRGEYTTPTTTYFTGTGSMDTSCHSRHWQVPPSRSARRHPVGGSHGDGGAGTASWPQDSEI